MIRSNNYLADILRVCEIKDLIWAMRFQSPLVYLESPSLHLQSLFKFIMSSSTKSVQVMASS